MSPQRMGPPAQAWYRWRALRLPWRKRFFVGHDLKGNTYWEFGRARGPAAASPDGPRVRRIVHYPRSTPYSEVRVSPLWHQWLRHARPDAPSFAEQRANVLRQERVKLLAAQADARWEAKPHVADAAKPAVPLTEPDPEPALQPPQARVAHDAVPEPADPWAKAKVHAPGQKWQPAPWVPAAGCKP